MPLDFDLPDFNVPPSKPPKMTAAAYDAWILQNNEDLRRAGKLDELLKRRPLPVGERFVWKDSDDRAD
ncbi:MAG: hypothetical protein ACI8UO_001371 [Verrucomicrobiales bacterium]|jgi:hypothetical protein